MEITISDPELTATELITAVGALRAKMKLPAAANPTEAAANAKALFGVRLRTQVQQYRTIVAIRDVEAIINNPETSDADRAAARLEKDAITKAIAAQFKAMDPPTVTFA